MWCWNTFGVQRSFELFHPVICSTVATHTLLQNREIRVGLRTFTPMLRGIGRCTFSYPRDYVRVINAIVFQQPTSTPKIVRKPGFAVVANMVTYISSTLRPVDFSTWPRHQTFYRRYTSSLLVYETYNMGDFDDESAFVRLEGLLQEYHPETVYFQNRSVPPVTAELTAMFSGARRD